MYNCTAVRYTGRRDTCKTTFFTYTGTCRYILLYSTHQAQESEGGTSRHRPTATFLHLFICWYQSPILCFECPPRAPARACPPNRPNLLSAQLSSLNGRYLHPTLPASVYCICHSNLRVHHSNPLEILRSKEGEVYSVPQIFSHC